MTITDFLEDRISEDEWKSRAIAASTPHGDLVNEYARQALADCAAKRMIVALHAPVKDEVWISGAAHDHLWCGSCGSIDDSPEPYPCDTLRALASIYMDHTDHQPEWAGAARG